MLETESPESSDIVFRFPSNSPVYEGSMTEMFSPQSPPSSFSSVSSNKGKVTDESTQDKRQVSSGGSEDIKNMEKSQIIEKWFEESGDW